MRFRFLRSWLLGLVMVLPCGASQVLGQVPVQKTLPPIRERYTKQIAMIPMRDGVKLFTIFPPGRLKTLSDANDAPVQYRALRQGYPRRPGLSSPTKAISSLPGCGCYMSEGQLST